MSFILTTETLRQIGTIYNVSKFILATKSVIEEIGGNEFNAAIHSLEDMKISNNPARELNMAITHLRSALEHFSSQANGFFGSISAMKQQFETALLIAICYKILSEFTLCEQYKKASMEYFTDWLNEYSYCPSGKLYWKEIYYNRVKDAVNEIGLSWTYSYPKGGFFAVFSSSHSKKFNDALEEHKEKINLQYKVFLDKI